MTITKRRLFVAATGATILSLGLWAFLFEPASLTTRNYRFRVTDWPASCDGLRVAVLGDLHVGARHFGIDSLNEAVAATNEADPDVVLLVGDYIHGGRNGATVAPEPIARAVSKLEAPLGTYGVLGNHDIWFDPERVLRAFEDEGIVMLENRSIELEREECRLRLVGVGDFRQRHHDLQAAFATGNPAELTSEDPGDPVAEVLFTHNPDLFPLLPDRVALAVAGHTHGGQVAFPVLGRLIVPSIYGERFAVGLIRERGESFFVTPGLGTSILPVRFRVPPEVSLLTIHSRSDRGRKAVRRSRVRTKT